MTFLAGKAHPNWKGGKSITSHGYIILKMPNHPRAMKNGYVYEHIIIAERKIGRPLKPSETIHHLDQNKLNNREENIIVVRSIKRHKVHHRKPNSKLRFPGENNPTITCVCGCGKEFLKYDKSGRPRQYLPGHSKRKLSDQDVNKIRQLYLISPYSQRELARMFNVGSTTVGNIILNKRRILNES